MTTDADGLEPDFGPPLERLRAFDAVRPAAGLPPPIERGIDGAGDFAQALRELLARVELAQARELCWCDPDFARWPLGDTAWIEALTRWARAGARELVMIAGTYAELERRHPRFVQWRRDFAHAVRCLEPDESVTAELPTLWIDSAGQAVRIFDAEHGRGRVIGDRAEWQRAREDFDAIAQRGTPAFAAATLGL